MGRLHLKDVKVGDFLEPDQSTGDLERVRLTASKSYQVIDVFKHEQEVFVKIQDDSGEKRHYGSLWFKYRS